MGRIAVLDKNMINMIAAGEVIERPASVVKELLENSIDAGAGKIIVRVEDGGRKLMSVVDDGVGMDAGDLATAFEPHATSKIKTSDDLLKISTMGFRGEALASIAAVSRVSVVSRVAGAIEANRVEIDCGDKQPVKPCSGDYGTAIEVRNLFYKLPARRKFLRTANTEMTHITEHFTRIALGKCELDMTLMHNERLLHRLLGGQSLRERIEQLFSKTVVEDLIETSGSEKGIRIFALLGHPAQARANSKFLYVFLNGRFIRDKFISHAIKEAYRGLIEPNKYPVVFLFLEVAGDAYDVNVHPTKIEVRFENANLIHSQVLAVLRNKLLSTNLDVSGRLPAPAVNLPGAAAPGAAERDRRDRIAAAMADFFKQNKPVGSSQQHFGFSGSPASPGLGQGKAVAPFETAVAAGEPLQTETAATKLLQLHNSYIVAQTDEGFIIIDQHALHERIVYEELCRKVAAGNLESQRLLIPETFELTDAEADAIKANAELIEKLGIELEPFGPKTMAIQSFPVMMGKVNPTDFVRDLIDMFSEKSGALDPERLLHEALDMAACKAAIKAGQPLSEVEIMQLLEDKETVERASRCPHGRPTTIKFTLDELEKQFKRT
jgi:DNA mismatch repair protein MutL